VIDLTGAGWVLDAVAGLAVGFLVGVLIPFGIVVGVRALGED
jgi:hypothetical protein